MSASPLLFITQTGPTKNKDTQTKVRRHVMKNIGKTRRKNALRGKLPLLQVSLEVPDQIDFFDVQSSAAKLAEASAFQLQTQGTKDGYPLNTMGSASGVGPLGGLNPTLERYNQRQILHGTSYAMLSIDRLWTGRMDPFLKYPIEMSHRALQLIDHVFDDRYGNTPPFRDAWMPVGMMDPAAFHQVLSNAALNLASLGSVEKVPETRETMKHHSKAIEMVARRILNPKEAITDGLLGAVIGFACYHHVIGNRASFYMHMDGVKEILRLRGGINSLDSNPLVRKVLSWVDIGGATTDDVPPYFPFPWQLFPRGLPSGKYVPFSPYAQRISNIWRWRFPDQWKIMNVLEDLHTFSLHLRNEVVRTNGNIFRNGEFAASLILPLQHDLLNLSVSTASIENPGSSMMQSCRLASLLYLAEIRRLFGIMGVVSTLQTEKLRTFLEMSGDEWKELGLLKTWCLVMGAIESMGPLRNWYVEELQRSMGSLGLSWDQAEKQLRHLLWFEKVHTPLFRDLYSGDVGNLKETGNHAVFGSRFGGYRLLR